MEWANPPSHFFFEWALTRAVLQANSSFCSLVGYEGAEEELQKLTFFRLVSAADLQKTLAVASKLLSGESMHATVHNHCVRKDGSFGKFVMDLKLLHRDGAPHSFVIFLRSVQTTTAA